MDRNQVHIYTEFPANISDEADTAGKLEGIVSKETQLKTLSIVDNVQDELEKRRKNRAELIL
ncbi:MAG: phage portal protein [Lachnoclostridium sp.]